LGIPRRASENLRRDRGASKYYLEGEAKKDFEAALDGVPDEKRAWASKQAGYHLVAEFMRTHSEPTNKKVDSATYMQLKQQILTDSDLK